MSRRRRGLSPSMTIAEFDRGYWFAVELKAFAASIGVPSASKLRKDELERAITSFLTSGAVEPPRRSLTASRTRDTDRELRLGSRIVGYVNNRATKEFLEREAQKLSPTYRRRSGARYRLNRWREEQLARGARITYRDLVAEYVRLSQSAEPFARIPHGRYINFVSDFLAAEPEATHAKAAKAWSALKAMDVPKTYEAWTGATRRR